MTEITVIYMAENRCSCGQGSPSSGSRETVCIDTMRVLDSCRDRDCYEDVRLYLTPFGQELIDRTCNVRTVGTEILTATLSVDPVPFNRGFYQITARFYIKVSCEACVPLGKAQPFAGLAVLEKSVILYGSEGGVNVFISGKNSGFCNPTPGCESGDNLPRAVVETVDPIILSCHVAEPECHCTCPCALPCGCDGDGMPEAITCAFSDGVLQQPADNGKRLLVSIGMFSVIRLERRGQFLVSATEYAVPDKECLPAETEDDPCRLFRAMAFPTGEFNPPALHEKHC